MCNASTQHASYRKEDRKKESKHKNRSELQQQNEEEELGDEEEQTQEKSQGTLKACQQTFPVQLHTQETSHRK